ncbi:unnamed protein product [Chrysoparadoxa australica]
MDSKLPLVLVGEPGIGKNALLSNWVKQRQLTRNRDEFLYQYFAGASTRAKQLAHMLHKLESALKDFFQLREMEVPTSEERLIWSLNRFLAAAAKKNMSSRMVVVIDGIHALKGTGMPMGALHWLPTELPPGVRFILSTVKRDDGNAKQKQHRTYLELQRRKCPFLAMERLDEDCQSAIIKAFVDRHPGSLQLNENQTNRIIQLETQSKPLYLRTLLYALSLGVRFGCNNEGDMDELLDMYLGQPDSLSLTSTVLDKYASYIDEDQQAEKIISAVLSVLFTSRNGLTDDEVWGAAEMVLGYELNSKHKDTMLHILHHNTMLVQQHRSFCHGEFKTNVYNKYIATPEMHIHLHIQMARYFDRLPASDRKVECLPYHLEVAGSWNKLKNCLVDIDMFDIWWQPKHKEEFILLWASLTNAEEGDPYCRKLITSEFEKTMEGNQSPRPCFDLVEEYCRSLDEYKAKTHPSDEHVSSVILAVADFLLEFATLGHEVAADIPQFVHPNIPYEDLASMGVPFLSTDEDGRSILNKPVLAKEEESDRPSGVDVPPKPNEDFPSCTSYFYYRWMWIMFPWVALANCGGRYLKGIELQSSEMASVGRVGGVKGGIGSLPTGGKKGRKPGLLTTKDKSRAGHRKKPGEDQENETLPRIGMTCVPKVQRRCSRTVKREPKGGQGKTGSEQDQNYWHYLMDTIRNDIKDLKEEFDILVQQRVMLVKKKAGVDDEHMVLTKLAASTVSGEDRINELKAKEDRVMRSHTTAKLLAKNYKSLLLMCERHPAHCQALIDELEIKLAQDRRLVGEFRKRCHEEVYERMIYQVDYGHLRKVVQEAAALNHGLLMSGYKQHQVLQRSNTDDTARLNSLGQSLSSESTAGRRAPKTRLQGTEPGEGNAGEEDEIRERAQQLEGAWNLIRRSTGIVDAETFIQKYLNTDQLEAQMMELKHASELRSADLKQEMQALEGELEDARYSSLSIGGNKEARNLHQRVAASQVRLKHSKERAESVEQLQRNAIGGLRHICSMLGVEEPDEISGVPDAFLQLEQALDLLVDEKDKTSQKGADVGGIRGGPMLSTDSLSGSLDLSITRPPEIEAALQVYTSPKTRIARQLLNRRSSMLDSYPEIGADSDDGEGGKDSSGTVTTRLAVKQKAAKSFRAEQRRIARLEKQQAIMAK